jgi:rhomboid family GlyGly-CTERM serine protease
MTDVCKLASSICHSAMFSCAFMNRSLPSISRTGEPARPASRAGWWVATALPVVLQCLPARARDALAYDRAAIAAGEVWRLVTGHFVHLGWAHCLLNVACVALCASVLAARDRAWVTLGGLAAGCGVLLWVGAPEVARYVGLSGVVYGLAVRALWPYARRDRWVGLVLLALVARVGWQVCVGTPRAEAAWLGGPVLAQGHVAGLVAGGLWAAWRTRRTGPAPRRGSQCERVYAGPRTRGRSTVHREPPMPYLLLIIEPSGQRTTRTRDEGEALYARMTRFADELRARGVLRAVESLVSADAAARVQVRHGATQVLDGPFAEAKEMVGGFFLLDVDTRDEALAIAKACPAAEWCTVEVREIGPCFF